MTKSIHVFLFALSAFSLFVQTNPAIATEPVELYAGSAAVDVTPPAGTPIGGLGTMQRRIPGFVDWLFRFRYATFFAPAVGSLDPIRSKAFVLKNSQRTMAFISLDVVGVNKEMHDLVAAKLKKIGFDDVIISATHTHSGPGALSKSWVWELLAMDKFNKEIFNGFVKGVLASVEKAYAQLEPAELYATSFHVDSIHHSRRSNQDAVDHKANLLLAKSFSGRWIGGIANYAIHGTILDEDNHFFSADAPGGIERALERALVNDTVTKRPVIAFINGAEGDVTPNYEGSAQAIDRTGREFTEKAVAALPLARKIDPSWSVRYIFTRLDRAKMHMGRCGVYFQNKPLQFSLAFTNKAMPRDALVSQIQIGDIFMMTWPGEPTSNAGILSKELAQAHGHRDVWILGLTDGHMGYFATRQEFQEGGYEPCMTLHGVTAVEKIMTAHKTILERKE